jgi:hypothetical protein
MCLVQYHVVKVSSVMLVFRRYQVYALAEKPTVFTDMCHGLSHFSYADRAFK